MELSDVVAGIRAGRITQRALARAAKVTQTTISNIVTGKTRDPRLSVANALIKAYENRNSKKTKKKAKPKANAPAGKGVVGK